MGGLDVRIGIFLRKFGRRSEDLSLSEKWQIGLHKAPQVVNHA